MNKKEKDKHYLPSCISTSSQKRLLKTGLFLWIPGRRKIKIESQHVHVKAMGKCQIFHIIIYNTHTFRLIFSNNFTSALQKLSFFQRNFDSYAAAAAKSLQSCLTLCDPIDSSPSGSSIPGILQARIMEWAAISFSNACMHAKLLQSCSTLLTLILEGNYQTLIFLSHLIFLIKLNFYIQIQAWFFQAWK